MHTFEARPVPIRHQAPQSVQPKLEVSRPGDRYEREAEAVAEQVVRQSGASPSPRAQPPCACGGRCTQCRRKMQGEGHLQRKEAGTDSRLPSSLPARAQGLFRTSGQPLDAVTRADMEPRFGYDLSRIRIYADQQAAETATALGASAFTVGHRIAFNRGRLAPHTSAGRRLLAHELTHVVQQGGGLPLAQAPESEHSVAEPARNSGAISSVQQACDPMLARLSIEDCSKDCTKGDGVDTETGKFWLTVYADKEGPFLLLPGTHKVGHSWLRLEDDKGTYWTFGFWPQDGYDAGDVNADVEGCVHHPDISHEPTSQQKFELTAAQFASAFNLATSTCANKPKYNLFGLQCTEFVKQVMAAAGQGPSGGFGLIWESPNSLDTWIRTHSLVLGSSVTAATSAKGAANDAAGVGNFGIDLGYRYQFYSVLGEKLRFYAHARGEYSDPLKSLAAGGGVELNPQKIWLPTPFIEGGGTFGDLNPLSGKTDVGAGVMGAAGLRFNIDEIGVIGVEYNLVKDLVQQDPVLNRLMFSAGLRLF